jgi:hypothetical protein
MAPARPIGRVAGMLRIGIHLVSVPPGTRTSPGPGYRGIPDGSSSAGTFQYARSSSVTLGSTRYRTILPSLPGTNCVPYNCGLPSRINFRSRAAATNQRACPCLGSRATAFSANSSARWMSSTPLAIVLLNHRRALPPFLSRRLPAFLLVLVVHLSKLGVDGLARPGPALLEFIDEAIPRGIGMQRGKIGIRGDHLGVREPELERLPKRGEGALGVTCERLAARARVHVVAALPSTEARGIRKTGPAGFVLLLRIGHEGVATQGPIVRRLRRTGRDPRRGETDSEEVGSHGSRLFSCTGIRSAASPRRAARGRRPRPAGRDAACPLPRRAPSRRGRRHSQVAGGSFQSFYSAERVPAPASGLLRTKRRA